MSALWQTETGLLACRWSEVGQHDGYNPPWFEEAKRTRKQSLLRVDSGPQRLKPHLFYQIRTG